MSWKGPNPTQLGKSKKYAITILAHGIRKFRGKGQFGQRRIQALKWLP